MQNAQGNMVTMKCAKTEAGQAALKERSPQLTFGQRSALILFDGKKTVGQVLAATEKLGVVRIDIDHLLALGYIGIAEGPVPSVVRPAPASPGPGVAATVAAAAPVLKKSECFIRAWPIAIRLTRSLGPSGFKLYATVVATARYDELVALLPAITDAAGPEKVSRLKEVLGA